MKNIVTILVGISLVLLGACGTRGTVEQPMMSKVSDLVAMPDFVPGMGTLYVDPDTLPIGPFAAYDRSGALVSTIYMVPLDAINDEAAFGRLPVVGHKIVSVDMKYNPGHPGVDQPHFHIVMWHVDPAIARLQ